MHSFLSSLDWMWYDTPFETTASTSPQWWFVNWNKHIRSVLFLFVRVFFIPEQKWNYDRNWYQGSGVVTVIKLNMWFSCHVDYGLLLVVEEFGIWVRKATEYWKPRLMNCFRKTLENKNSERCVDSQVLTYDTLDKNRVLWFFFFFNQTQGWCYSRDTFG